MRNNVDNMHKYHLLAIFAISLFCIIIYSNTLDTPFVFDDLPNIKNNPYIRLTSLDFGKLYDAASKSPCSNRPLANISLALNYYFGKYGVTGYHIVNIVIHLINGILVYFLALIIFRQVSDIPSQKTPQSQNLAIPKSPNPSIILMSLFTALIFIAHPLQTQTVTYIVQRMTSMAVLFYLLSLLFYIHGRLSQLIWKRWALFSACFVSWIMALGSKEIAVTLPFVILLYEWYFFQDLSIAWLKRNIKYVLIPIAVLFLFTLIYLGGNPFDKLLAGYTLRDFTMVERVLTEFRVVIFYISLLLFPYPSRLNLLHYFTTSQSLFDPITTLLSLLIVVCFIGLAIYLSRRHRLVSFCILWFFINLVIESSVVSLELTFEHRLYLPMFGFALLASYLPFYLLSNKQLWAVIILVIITVLLGTGTYLRNNTWQDDIALWADVLSKNPQSARAHLNIGAALVGRGSLDEAISHYYEALRIKPYYVRVHNNLGIALREKGKIDEAISHYQQALRIRPNYADAHNNLALALKEKGRLDEAILHYEMALKSKPQSAETHNNLGIALREKGEIDKAITHYYKALRFDPNLGDAHYNLAVALMHQGRLEQAATHLSETLRINPNDAPAHNSLGNVLTQLGELDKAIAHFSKAIRIRADYADAHNNLAGALKKKGKLDEAISHYYQALKIQPGLADVHNNLGNALTQQGDLDKAIAHFSKAIEIRENYAGAHNNLGIALARQGRLKEAIAHFSEALRINPDEMQARHNLGIALQKAKAQEARTGTTRP